MSQSVFLVGCYGDRKIDNISYGSLILYAHIRTFRAMCIIKRNLMIIAQCYSSKSEKSEKCNRDSEKYLHCMCTFIARVNVALKTDTSLAI